MQMIFSQIIIHYEIEKHSREISSTKNSKLHNFQSSVSFLSINPCMCLFFFLIILYTLSSVEVLENMVYIKK